METQNNKFNLKADWKPAGDQPEAIKSLVTGVNAGNRAQTLLGVTGSGKTFTIANVIQKVQKPTLVIAHNKTLAAQLAQEYQSFFPDNAVHYFVSYYDYYQPEAYIATTDTYIEKDAQINEEIDRLRHASTQALLSRNDVIIVASVSCIYGLGSPEEYLEHNWDLRVGMKLGRREYLEHLVNMHFTRTTADLEPGSFRALGNMIEIMPVSERVIVSLKLVGSTLAEITIIDAVTRRIQSQESDYSLYPAKHFVTTDEQQQKAIVTIQDELKERLEELEKAGELLAAERLKRRTNYDLAMIREVGYCNGIENYSRHLSGKAPGEAPNTLLSYFPHKEDGTPDFLTVIDESHVSVPQIGGMYAGDASRKKNLVKHGFRLPSALDNRPLKFEEFLERVGQMIFTTATPGKYEKEESAQVVEQVIRPTGLLDPEIEIRGVQEKGEYPGQVFDFIDEAVRIVESGDRVLVTTLTKKMAEDLSEFLKEKNVKAEYLHSDVKTIDRIQILTRFRKGDFDCLVGVNLLREGLDLPEVSFIGILDADKEGFLRSETSLIQTIGRAARNERGKVILYADRMTGSIEKSVNETNRRRALQIEYNEKHGIKPETIKKNIHDITEQIASKHDKTVRTQFLIDEQAFKEDPDALIKQKEKEMNEAAKLLDFETAAILRDELKELEKLRSKK